MSSVESKNRAQKIEFGQKKKERFSYSAGAAALTEKNGKVASEATCEEGVR